MSADRADVENVAVVARLERNSQLPAGGGLGHDGRHRDDILAPGVVKRVYEAMYVKVLAADADVLRPQAESMTPRTKALYDFLFAA